MREHPFKCLFRKLLTYFPHCCVVYITNTRQELNRITCTLVSKYWLLISNFNYVYWFNFLVFLGALFMLMLYPNMLQCFCYFVYPVDTGIRLWIRHWKETDIIIMSHHVLELAFIFRRLHYCDGVFTGLSKKSLRLSSHISPVLRSLHRSQIIDLKLLLVHPEHWMV